MTQIVDVKGKPELASLIDEYNQEMELKRMTGRVCLSYGLSQSKHSEEAWDSYHSHLQKCEQLKSKIDELMHK